MKDIYWNKLNNFRKFIFAIGWLSVLNLGFWLALLVHNSLTQEDKFWTPESFRVVYVFGWINLIVFIFLGILFIGLSLFEG